GGYGDNPATPADETQWSDALPWLWDEGAAPNPQPKGFDPRYLLSNRSHEFSLDYFDFPGVRPGGSISFSVQLVSLDANGKLDSFHEGFTWTYKNTGDAPEVNVRRAT